MIDSKHLGVGQLAKVEHILHTGTYGYSKHTVPLQHTYSTVTAYIIPVQQIAHAVL
jgi:hypothetical protein